MTPGQLSGDGKWQWDGKQWVPAPPTLVPTGPYPPAVMTRTPPTNSLAIVSLVAAILSWVLCPFIGAVVAVITGHIARNQIRTSGEAGDGLALVGLVVGYLHLAAWAVGIFLWLVILGGFAWLAASGSH